MTHRELEPRLRSWFQDDHQAEVPATLAGRVAAIPAATPARPWFRRPMFGRLPALAAVIPLLLTGLIGGGLVMSGLRSPEPSPASASPQPPAGWVIAPADVDICGIFDVVLDTPSRGGDPGASWTTCHGPGYDGDWGSTEHLVWARFDVGIEAVPDLLMTEVWRFEGRYGDLGPWVARRHGVWVAADTKVQAPASPFHVAAFAASPYFFFVTSRSESANLQLADAVVREIERLNGTAWHWPWPDTTEDLLPSDARCGAIDPSSGAPADGERIVEAFRRSDEGGDAPLRLFADGRLLDLSAARTVAMIRSGEVGWTVRQLSGPATEAYRGLVVGSGMVRPGCHTDLLADGRLRGVSVRYQDGRSGSTDIGSYPGFEQPAHASLVAAFDVLLRQLADPAEWVSADGWLGPARWLRPDRWVVRVTQVPPTVPSDPATPLLGDLVMPDGTGMLEFGSSRDIGSGVIERCGSMDDAAAVALLLALDQAGDADSPAYFRENQWSFRVEGGGHVSIAVSPVAPGEAATCF